MSTAIKTAALSLSRLRRELQQMPEIAPSLPNYSSATPEEESGKIYDAANFDTNVVIIVAALLCILVCALGINWLLRWALRCSRRIAFESSEELALRRANTGMKKNAVKAIPTMVYSSAKSGAPNASECLICLGEFADGENVRVLPNCRHSFHIKCIDTWLVSHSSCPTCRHILRSFPERKSRTSSNDLQHEAVGELRPSSYSIQDSYCQESCTDRISSDALAADDPPPVLAGAVESPPPMQAVVEISTAAGTLQP